MAIGPKLGQATDQNFEATVLGASKPVLVDFWAAWCAPCKMLRPVVEDLAAEYGERVTIVELDVVANPIITSRFSLLSIPTLTLLSSQKTHQRVVEIHP